MTANKKRTQAARPVSGNPYRGRIAALFILSLMLGFVYLWGKVQIDFRLRHNEELRSERDHLKREVVHLKLQISTKSRYQRIVKLAQEQGLVFVSTSKLKNLEVEMPESEVLPVPRPQSYASVVPVKIF